MAQKGWDSDDELLDEIGGGINAFPSVKDEDYNEDELLGNSDEDADGGGAAASTGGQVTLGDLEDLDDNAEFPMPILLDDGDQEYLDEDEDEANQLTITEPTEQDTDQLETVQTEDLAGDTTADLNESQNDNSLVDANDEEPSSRAQQDKAHTESDSESDEEESGHRGRFMSERQNIITLTTSGSRPSTSAIPDSLDGYGARPQREGPKHWQQQGSNNRPSGPRYPGPPRQPWERSQGRRQPPRQHGPQPYQPRQNNHNHSHPFHMQKSVQRHPTMGLLGMHPAQRSGMLHQAQLQQPQRVLAVAQPRNMFINPNFKGTMQLPQAKPAWEEQPGYDNHFRQQQQQQPQQQHMQHMQQHGGQQVVYGSHTMNSPPYSNNQSMAGGPQYITGHSPPGSGHMQQQQQQVPSQRQVYPQPSSGAAFPQHQPTMDTDMRVGQGMPHSQGAPYPTSPPQPLMRTEPRFPAPQQFQQQQQQFPPQQHPGHQQQRFRAPHQQHFTPNNAPIGQPIQTLVQRQVRGQAPTARQPVTNRLGPAPVGHPRPRGQPMRSPRPLQQQNQQQALAPRFQQRSPGMVRPRQPAVQQAKQPPKPKPPTAEELEEERRRQRRLQRFSSTSTVTSSGKISLKRESTGEPGEEAIPVKQARAVVTTASSKKVTVNADEELRCKLEEQKRLRQEALARKERNRRAAAGPRLAELQQKLAEQGKSLCDVEGAPVPVINRTAQETPAAVAATQGKAPQSRMMKVSQVKQLLASQQARGGRGAMRGAGRGRSPMTATQSANVVVAVAEQPARLVQVRGQSARGRGRGGRGHGVSTRGKSTAATSRVVQPGVAVLHARTVVQPQAQDQQQNRRVVAVSTRVLVTDLANSTSDYQLRQLAGQVGPLKAIQLKKQERSAVLNFHNPADAAAFSSRFNRHMLDLSMIKAQILPS